MSACVECKSTTLNLVYSNIKDWEFGFPGNYSYQKCSECNSVTLFPFPDIETLKLAYSSGYVALRPKDSQGLIYRCLDSIRQFMLKRRFALLLKPGSKILDVGCGSGELLIRLRKAVKFKELHLCGIDFNSHACEQSQQKGIQVFQGTFLDYPNTDAKFDVIFMINYIEHVLSPSQEIKFAYSLLKESGRLIGELPNFSSLDRILFGRFWGGNHAPRHTFQFSPGALKKLLSDSGFTEISVTVDPNPGHLALSIQNCIVALSSRFGKQPKLAYGRATYMNFLLLILIPFGYLMAAFKINGNMRFEAVKSNQ